MIDAHVHIWRLGRNGCAWPPPELAAIHRDHELAEAAAVIADAGIDAMMLVQSQESEDDTAWLLAEAAAFPIVAGVVGWIDPHAADVAARLTRLQDRGPLVGLRVMAQDRPPEWLAEPALHGLFDCLRNSNLTLDLLVRPQHLPACAAFAARLPDLRIVIDHCAKPAIADGGFAAWRAAIAPLADRPSVHCKLSGLIVEAAPGQPIEELAPYIEAALELFGPDRLMWGSDWPVLNLRGHYRDWLDFARAIVPLAQHDAVFDGTARAFYRLAA